MSKHDEKIKLLLEKVESQKAGLGQKPRANWATNGIFRYDDKRYFNINTVQSPQDLVDALAFLLEKNLLQSDAAEKLGVEGRAFVWNGYSIEDWQDDFKLRIEILNWQDRKKQLEATQKKLNSLVSEEGKTEMALQEIEKLLS